MEITEMTLKDLDDMKDILYSDFDNFWSYNILKQELENPNTTAIHAIINIIFIILICIFLSIFFISN